MRHVPNEPYAVVIGGAAFDVKARSLTPVRLRTSNPGRITRTPGGVGRNIAENLARLGCRVHLVATIGSDPDGDELLAQTARAGVETGHMVRSPHPTGSYLALLDSDGELLAGISDFSATDALTVSEVSPARELVAGAGVAVVDANLPAAVVAWVLEVVAVTGARVVLEPVSVVKAGRLSGLVDPGRPLFAVTPNTDELAALAGVPVNDEPQAITAAARLLHARGVTHVWVSRGPGGSLLCSADGTVTALPAQPAEVVDVTGAGDALTAGFVRGLLAGQEPADAARSGHLVAALTIASPHTVRPDLGEVFARVGSSIKGAAR